MPITPLTHRDSQAASLLHQNAFFKGWGKSEFDELLANPCIHGLKTEDHHELSGYILWREVLDEAEILTLVVAPSFQRKGQASLLLNALFEITQKKNITILYLEVAEDNLIAQSFYKKNGFTFLSERKNYYRREDGKSVTGLNFFKKIL